MNTAMQEHIEEIQYWKEKAPFGSAFRDCLIILEGSAMNRLEKEKEEQKKMAVDFFHWNNKGLLTNGNSKTEDAFEDFYNQTFNKQ